MKEYLYTKIFGVTLGVVTILTAMGFGILAFIGSSLSKALNSGYEHSSADGLNIFVFIPLLLLGLMTIMGSYRLKSKTSQLFYAGFCFVLCVCFVAAFFFTFGAIGTKSEIFLLCIGLVYFLLGYLAKKKK